MYSRVPEKLILTLRELNSSPGLLRYLISIHIPLIVLCLQALYICTINPLTMWWWDTPWLT